MELAEKRILSIQSHVVSGYVGNKAAVFPLQILGYDVDVLNCVQLSNHTGYKIAKGQRLDGNDLADLMTGLSQNGLDNYSHILTGFANNSSFLNEIANVVQYLKNKNPHFLYVCDPVLGDNGRIYVPHDLVPIYQNKIMPLADIILPNKFELEWLTGKEVNDLQQLFEATDQIHSKGCNVVVVTSAEFTTGLLTIVASVKTDKNCERAIVDNIKKIPCYISGTGDLFSALFLAWMDKSYNNIVTSLENTVNTINAVITKTWKAAQDRADYSPEMTFELKLIQSKHDIENPNNDAYKVRLL